MNSFLFVATLCNYFLLTLVVTHTTVVITMELLIVNVGLTL